MNAPTINFFSTSKLALSFFALQFLSLCFLPSLASAQSAPVDVQPSGLLRIKVKPKINGKEKELPRKRFFLIKGGLEENKALVERINSQTLPTRECFYRNAKASERFIDWLKAGDCESVYCRAIEEEFVSGPKAVREFELAYQLSAKEYGKPELARQWLTTNLTDEIRDGFYRLKQVALNQLMNDVTTSTGTPVISVMTDRKGTAFFTHLPAGTYLVSNLMPTEIGDKSGLWTCEVTIGTKEKRLQLPIPNARDKTVKCVVIENPLPACDLNKQTASK